MSGKRCGCRFTVFMPIPALGATPRLRASCVDEGNLDLPAALILPRQKETSYGLLFPSVTLHMCLVPWGVRRRQKGVCLGWDARVKLGNCRRSTGTNSEMGGR